ncbi:hypothetical protein IRJ41_004249 [Triplophysa rosa]|uniref:Uncharacterized protein n=1 Tax=Triplophysa rosa TaxID=992332 RepID=A0A9W7TCY7_TRIRA|nr:hypothetical protein IRJ41_004249 [Triplophysa rosa]
MVNRPNAIGHEEDTFLPPERDTLKQSMALMRHLLMDAQLAVSLIKEKVIQQKAIALHGRMRANCAERLLAQKPVVFGERSTWTL